MEIAHFGSSAFRITTALGPTLMVDRWRNYPTGAWGWYFRDFPRVAVDIGISGHAHFDHDALHRLDASVLLDRLIGGYRFADLDAVVHVFGEHVAFDKEKWRAGEHESVNLAP